MEKHTVFYALVDKIPLLMLGLVIVIGGVGRLGYESHELDKQKMAEEAEFGAVRQALEDKTNQLKQDLASAKLERDGFEQKYNDEKDQVDAFAGQVQNISGTVGTLVKLSQTDSELLKKYSKVYFLNENYVPKKLTSIDASDIYGEKAELLESDVWPFLKNLLEAASSSGIGLEIISAYRSFGEQSNLKTSYKIIYGAGTANQFSADQGYSEHQLGTAVDFTTPDLGDDFVTFNKTSSYEWLLNNAYKYGFVLSYPQNNTYYKFEPWHWRFVGRNLAQILHEDNKHFYDMDQREINKFLVNLFD